MVEELRFSDGKQLEAWLKDKPADWSRVIARRAAMRVVPAIGWLFAVNISEDVKRRLWLCVYRASLISSAARKWPAEDMEAAAYSAYSAAYSAAHSALSAAESAEPAALSAESAAYSAYSAYSAADSAAFSALSAALSAAESAAFFSYLVARSVMWEVVTLDARALDRGETVEALSVSSLWPDVAPPLWFSEAWRELSTDPEVLDAGFKPWLDWYAALVPLNGSKKPRDIFGPELTKKIALQPDEWWDRDAAEVNADIARWLDEKRKGETNLVDDIATISNDIPQQVTGAYRFQWREGALTPLPPDPAKDADDAAILLGEARRKALEFAERLKRTNVEPRIKRSVELVLDALPETNPVNGLLLWSRTSSIEEDAVRFARSPEVPDDVQSHLADLGRSLRGALTCFPNVREVEAESLALALQSANIADVAQLVRHADAVLETAREAPPEIIHPATVTALEDMAKSPEEPGTLPQSLSALRRLADRLVVTRNYLVAVARGAVVGAFDGATAVGGKAKAHWDDVRPKIAEATLEGAECVGTPLGYTAVATLVVTIVGTLNPWVLTAVPVYPVIKVYLDMAIKRGKPPPDDDS